MTEDEAKTKWCPFSRQWDETCATNRDNLGEPHDGALCIASACMAWRWAGTVSQYARKADVPGFCGLSGPPQ